MGSSIKVVMELVMVHLREVKKSKVDEMWLMVYFWASCILGSGGYLKELSNANKIVPF